MRRSSSRAAVRPDDKTSGADQPPNARRDSPQWSLESGCARRHLPASAPTDGPVATPTLVAHTGDLAAAGRRRRIHHITLLVTADHGNAERMLDRGDEAPHTRHTDSPVPRWLVGRDCALSATGAPGGLPNRHRTNRPTTSRASPHPDETCDDRFPVSAQAHAGTCGQTGRPPPLATPMHGDRDAKCVCAGQVRCCFALWSEHGPRYAVKHDPKTHT
jgi:Metalloenzyme superfamily